ncbi:MAG: hypothetical protein RLY66_697 [Candidatus Parcubacteria bacterium]|jgi:hypothetical protein
MKSKIISSTLVILGFVLGATALSAIAAWTAPSSGCTPPTCNTEAPIHVGAGSQSKLGLLTLQSNLTDAFGLAVANGIKIVDASVTAGTASGKVLTSDASGIGTWQSLGSAVSGMNVYTSSGTWTVPAGAKFAEVTVVAGGGSGSVRVNGSNSFDFGHGGAASKVVSLNGVVSASFTVGAAGSLGYPGGASSITIGGITVSASPGSSSNGIGSGGDINGTGPYFGFGLGEGSYSSSSSRGGVVVIKYY